MSATRKSSTLAIGAYVKIKGTDAYRRCTAAELEAARKRKLQTIRRQDQLEKHEALCIFRTSLS